MTSGMPSLLDAIFGKQKLEEISLEEIYSVIGEFPSFNAAHFLLSKKLKEENDPAYPEETRKTALYFNNPVWLQLLLNEELNPEAEAKQMPFEEGESPASASFNPHYEQVPESQTATIALDETFNSTEEEVISPAQEYGEPERQYVAPELEYKDPAEEYKEEPAAEEYKEPVREYTEPAQEFSAPLQDDTDPIQESGAPEQDYTEPIQEYKAPESENTAPAEDYSETIIHQPSTINEEYREPDQEITVNEEYAEVRESRPILNQEFAEEPQPVITVNQEYAMEEAHIPTVNQEFARETDAESFDRPAHHSSPHQPSTGAEDGLTPPLFDAKKAESIVFAPYHMIDYFASQGIKLTLDDQPSDNFGKQLKSFTDWLKVMKRLPQKQLISEKTDEREAERIRHFAAHSIEERDILTETMAEVLAKQGMYENAIALYQKLSLIYPPKSAYFASRIEQLKASLS